MSTSHDHHHPHHHHAHGLHEKPATSLATIIGALGVVYGDIGTSPIYTLKECFSAESAHHIAATAGNVTGVVSLILWSLFLLVCVKYLSFVLRADNKGEGGILSLMALAVQGLGNRPRRHYVTILLGLFGAALLFGDGMITPAISVLSAVEGLRDGGIFGMPPEGAELAKAWNEHMQLLIIAITVVILIGLFAFQFIGTQRVGKFFGPITLVWFLCLAVMGIANTLKNPAILAALNPLPGLQFLLHGGHASFIILGSVFLAVTGGEALYADMGHFGANPIRVSWYSVVFPSLVLNYLGQGALLLSDPAKADSPFFHMAPEWGMLPLVLLATAATVIASQALITGTYSLTLSAIQLGYLPRVSIHHTSEHARGQIYVPLINWGLLVACVALVLAFKTSSNLAAAYGVAVTMTMLITTVLFYFVARNLWGWSNLKVLPWVTIFALVELGFLASNLLKFIDGGWLPITAGLLLFLLMSTWETGRRLVRQRLSEGSLPQEMLIDSLKRRPPIIVPGTAIFMASNKGQTPVAFLHNLKHNGILHKRVIFLTLVVEDAPWVRRKNSIEIEELGDGIWRITGHYGFMQRPNVTKLLRQCHSLGLDVSAEESTFFLGREVIVPSGNLGMSKWREQVFAVASKLAEQPASYFQIPIGRVIELGQQVEI